MENKTSLDLDLLRDRVLLFKLWGEALSSGVPLRQSMDVLAETFPRYATALSDIRTSIRGGDTICDSAGKYPELFPEPALALMEAGEECGVFDSALKLYSDMAAETLDYKLKRKEVPDELRFYTMMSFLITHGSSMVSSLKRSSSVCEEPFKGVVNEIINKIDGGSSLSKAMADYQSYFPSYVIALVRIGEIGGVLDETLGTVHRCVYGKEEFPRSNEGLFYYAMGYAMGNQLRANEWVISLEASASVLEEPLKTIVSGIAKKVQEGSTLSSAMIDANHFPKYAIALVRAGEVGGCLDEVMSWLSRYEADKIKLEEKLASK